MPRLFCDSDLIVGTDIDMPKEIARHLMVLRLSVGDEVTLFNGQGGEYQAKLTAIGKNSAVATVVSHQPVERELPYRVALAQGLPEAGKMDWIVEKAVEMGVSDILPVSAERSVVRLNGDRAEKRVERWRAIVVAAVQQCGRNTLPEILHPMPLQQVIEDVKDTTCIMFSPRATQTLSAWAKEQKPHNITILIGPEGGFSPAEEKQAVDAGVVFLSMGDRILRTETAGIAAVAAINAIWEQA